MLINNQKKISAITYSYIQAELPEGSANISPNNVSNFVIDQFQNLPIYARLFFITFNIWLDIISVATRGKSFQWLEAKERWSILQASESSYFPYHHEAVLFYRKMILFAWYSEIE